MTENELLELAKSAGLLASITTPDQIVVDKKFRAYCEENRCGNYNANYSCPPDCGTVDNLHKNLLAEEKVLVLQSQWNNFDKNDKKMLADIRVLHNQSILRVMKQMKELGYDGFCAGNGGCSLCNPCKRKENLPCIFPELRISCISSYCIDVTALSQTCNLPFAWEDDRLYLFGLVAFHKKHE